MNKFSRGRAYIFLALALLAGVAQAGLTGFLRHASEELSGGGQGQTFTIGAAGTMEIAFSPREGATALVVKAINSAQTEVHMLSYSFTSAPVVNALVAARKRGVSVTLVADYKNNVSEDKSGKARAALSTLVNAGADVRVIAVYQIHHDKVIVVDRKHVELGSFNYSSAAESSNSENVLVNWNNPQLAQVYLGHFQRNYAQSKPFQSGY